ncbi:hypothetical protein [Ramlibacter sp.]|uniref:hypothetical protein n=1 Tax=Ramlibacter sp. TaxID=1917967 RepID=UPI0025ED43E5|nr:hypothetical protein [Ramlibacter sp.]
MSSRKFPKIEEGEMRRQEARLPDLAKVAGENAHRRSLQRFGQVLTVQNNQMVDLRSDGSVTVVKTLPPVIKVPTTLPKVKVRLAAKRKKQP